MEASWVCVHCRARSPESADLCSGCGVAFGAGLTGPPVVARSRRGLYVLREIVLLNLLFVLWRVVGRYALTARAGADRRGLDLWRAERWLHLPSEAALQQATPSALLRVADAWYAALHAPVLAVVLLWLLVRHRESYRRLRTTVVAFTAAALLLQLVPVAPPRLLPSLGVLDSARADGLSVYGDPGRGLADQLSAMPSVHVGWALLVALGVVGAARSRLRWLVLAYPAGTLWVVVVTGNHYWLDAVGAAVLLAVVGAVQQLISRRSRTEPAVADAPARAAVPV